MLVETIEYDDYQLRDSYDVEDVKRLDLTRVHPFIGPIAVKGAEPGTFSLSIYWVLSP